MSIPKSVSVSILSKGSLELNMLCNTWIYCTSRCTYIRFKH